MSTSSPLSSASSVAHSAGVVLVTGAGKRLGREIALALARHGYSIAVHFSASSKAADETVGMIESLGQKAASFKADLSRETDTAALIDQIGTMLGEPFAVVNSASAFIFDEAAGFAYAPFLDLMRINAAAPIVLARTLHARLTARGQSAPQGVVINLLDQKLFNPNPDFLSYTLSKAALHFATTVLAQALAPTLRVVGIAPGITLPSGGQTEQEFQAAHRLTPLGRSSTPEDIASAVLFALTNRAITGSTLIVDGGQHLVATPRDVMFHSK
jgi:NAD(P)-dependent dehydrogenase (short-subunit alcohol dehydrogenase family)